MARRRGFLPALERLAREAVRQQRLALAAEQRRIREQRARERESLRLQLQRDKAQRQQYLAMRSEEAEERTREIEAFVQQLCEILNQTLIVDDAISFDSLLIPEEHNPFVPPPELCIPCPQPHPEHFLSRVRPLSLAERLLGRHARFERNRQAAEMEFARAYAQFQERENARLTQLAELERAHQYQEHQRLEAIRHRNAEVAELRRAYEAGEPHAVKTYCSMVLERSQYPDGFPQKFRLAYAPDSKELIIDYELPAPNIVPRVSGFRYLKTKDTLEPIQRKPAEVKEIYQDVVAAVALRTLHEVFEADRLNHLAVVVFNGFIRTVDPLTGREIWPYLVSVRTTRERFAALDLSRVEKKACLRNLGARVSPHAAEVLPVKPLIEFDMVDKRFIEGADVLSGLESRPNLMDLTPFEFEQLVGNLFSKMGLETRQTRASRDGGVDVVAFDSRPVIGGKVVIQAKRYRNTVGVSAVRDLYGTMLHEGASKGILVTTSGYGPDARDFVEGKPIQLIDGGELLYYLEQYAGISARIVFPEDTDY